MGDGFSDESGNSSGDGFSNGSGEILVTGRVTGWGTGRLTPPYRIQLELVLGVAVCVSEHVVSEEKSVNGSIGILLSFATITAR